jgi:hypothetical protein
MAPNTNSPPIHPRPFTIWPLVRLKFPAYRRCRQHRQAPTAAPSLMPPAWWSGGWTIVRQATARRVLTLPSARHESPPDMQTGDRGFCPVSSIPPPDGEAGNFNPATIAAGSRNRPHRSIKAPGAPVIGAAPRGAPVSCRRPASNVCVADCCC